MSKGYYNMIGCFAYWLALLIFDAVFFGASVARAAVGNINVYDIGMSWIIGAICAVMLWRMYEKRGAA